MTENKQQQDLFQKCKEEVIETLRRIDKRLCMPEYTATSDVEDILLISREQLKKLNREDCKEHAWLLARHALFIQKDINHCEAWKNQATKIKARCLDVEHKVKCDAIIEAANLKLIKSQYLTRRLESIIKGFENLAFERKKDEYT